MENTQNPFSGNDKMAQAYQEGIQAAKEALGNQKKWERGEGDQGMARAYQEGRRSATEALRNQQKWKRSEGDQGIAEAHLDLEDENPDQ